MSDNRKPLNTLQPPELLARLDAYIARQAVPPPKARVVEIAIREFLDRAEPQPRKGGRK